MSLKLAALCAIVALVLWLGWAAVPWAAVADWAATQQRAFQDTMARALRGIQAGDPMAIWTLCLATAAYGFVHALGPGHGKVLIGGAALASGARLRRLLGLTLASSLAQAGTAIALVGGLVFIVQMGAQDLVSVTEAWLAPLSYAAIAAIGVTLMLRGVLAWRQSLQPLSPEPSCGCGHAHGPSPAQIDTLTTARDALALVASIAIRPCTGALFVLVIAARFDAFWVGALSVITMGFGTAAFNMLVAGSGVAAQRLAGLSGEQGRGAVAVSAVLHLVGGGLITLLSLAVLLPYLS